MKVLLAPEALEDLRAAVEYLAERNPDAASSLIERIFALAERLASGELPGCPGVQAQEARSSLSMAHRLPARRCAPAERLAACSRFPLHLV
jgi:plasmid stabilization system protein ParE